MIHKCPTFQFTCQPMKYSNENLLICIVEGYRLSEDSVHIKLNQVKLGYNIKKKTYTLKSLLRYKCLKLRRNKE